MLFRGSFILIAMIFLPLFPAPLSAREDSASLVLQKMAGRSKNRVHVVKKGEWIHSILRNQFGDEPIPYGLIRRLNPGIRNLNRIHPGQRIVLPILEESSQPSKPISDIGRENSSPPVIYRVLEGDSISRIILSEMNVKPEEALPAYRLIRKLNPEIQDLNRLPVGQTLRLPAIPDYPAVPSASPPKTPVHPAETSGTGQTAKMRPVLEGLMGIIRPVISRMRGAVTVTGSYFIPILETTQLTIDCSLIPVVELDDGTTVLLDYGNRLSENLKGLIRQSWKNYAFLAEEELLDGFEGLQRIIRHSQNYRMIHADKPLTLTVKPEILVYPDWIISGKETAGGVTYRQGLFLLDRGERPLPAEVRVFIEESGVAVTEIAENREVSSLETPPPSRPAMVDLRGLKGIALTEKLLTTLGETPVRNAEITIFDQDRNGFNLSVTADVLIRKGEKQFILLTKRLPEQFLRLLREAGIEVIPIGEKDQGRPLFESVLHGLGIPVSFGYFSFRIPEEGRSRITVSFSTLRATTEGEPVYLVDFDLPPALLPFLSGRRGGRVVRY